MRKMGRKEVGKKTLREARDGEAQNVRQCLRKGTALLLT